MQIGRTRLDSYTIELATVVEPAIEPLSYVQMTAIHRKPTKRGRYRQFDCI